MISEYRRSYRGKSSGGPRYERKHIATLIPVTKEAIPGSAIHRNHVDPTTPNVSSVHCPASSMALSSQTVDDPEYQLRQCKDRISSLRVQRKILAQQIENHESRCREKSKHRIELHQRAELERWKRTERVEQAKIEALQRRIKAHTIHHHAWQVGQAATTPSQQLVEQHHCPSRPTHPPNLSSAVACVEHLCHSVAKPALSATANQLRHSISEHLQNVIRRRGGSGGGSWSPVANAFGNEKLRRSLEGDDDYWQASDRFVDLIEQALLERSH